MSTSVRAKRFYMGGQEALQMKEFKITSVNDFC